MTDKYLLTASQVAMRLGCARQHVWRLVRAGVIPGFRIKHRYRFCYDEVLTALRKNNMALRG